MLPTPAEKTLLRFQNFQKAFERLQDAVKIPTLNTLEQAGFVQTFAFTFELAWKTLKDYLAFQLIEVSYPRDVIKEAAQLQLISDGAMWLEALESRNIMAHTYDQEVSQEIMTRIREHYIPLLEDFFTTMEKKTTDITLL